MNAVEQEAIRLGSLIRASEEWAPEYAKDPISHAILLKNEVRWQIGLTKMFRGIAEDAAQHVNWYAYQQLKADLTVDVTVNDIPFEEYDNTFIKVSFDAVATMAAAGALAGETIYSVPLGIQSTDAIMQELGMSQVAALVGKRVLKDGTIVDNPNPQYNITETMRKDILQSIKTSIALGEDITTATTRLQKTIANPRRAETIVQTESVNAYQAGLDEFAAQSGAVGKESQDVGAVDRCRIYTLIGPVPIDYKYDGIFLRPAYHVKCRCGRRLIYQAEWDSLMAKGLIQPTGAD